jgi:hypothetical protein
MTYKREKTDLKISLKNNILNYGLKTGWLYKNGKKSTIY